MTKEMLKRGFDIVASGTALVVLAPLMLVLAILVRLDSSGPSLFRQTRVGKSFREFQVLKFRTMKLGDGGAEVTCGLDARIVSRPQAGRVAAIMECLSRRYESCRSAPGGSELC